MTLGIYYEINGRVADAEVVSFALSNWQGLRDESLIARSGELADKLEAALAEDEAGGSG